MSLVVGFEDLAVDELVDGVPARLVCLAEAPLSPGDRDDRESDQAVGNIDGKAAARECLPSTTTQLFLEGEQTLDPLLGSSCLDRDGFGNKSNPGIPISGTAQTEEMILVLVLVLILVLDIR